MSRRVRILARFHPADVKRTGLEIGVVAEVLPVEGDARLWVRCPQVPRKTDGEFRMYSDGCTTLEAGQYEEIE